MKIKELIKRMRNGEKFVPFCSANNPKHYEGSALCARMYLFENVPEDQMYALPVAIRGAWMIGREAHAVFSEGQCLKWFENKCMCRCMIPDDAPDCDCGYSGRYKVACNKEWAALK